MNTLLFWKSWPSPLKQLFLFLLLLLSAAFVYYLISYFWSARLLIQWETISQIKTIPLILDEFYYGGIPLQISADFYAITQVFEGSDLQLATWPAHVLLGVMACCLVVGLALAADLSRFWYIVSQIVFIFILVGFKLEQLLLFDRTDKLALILAFVLYLPLGYYFHTSSRHFTILQRLLGFSLVTLIFAAVIYFFTGVTRPFLYLVNYGIAVPIVATLIFILFTAHEVIYGFLVLITRSNTPKSSNSFIHFFSLSLIYLANILLLYLKNSRRIDWDFYYLDAFWILIATTVIGLWGMKHRKTLYENIIPFEPHAALGYLALAVVSFGTIGYFFATANDPVIEAFEDAVVFSQLCIGFMFLLYILFNFRSVLIENLKVYKVAFKPQKMPFFTMRLGGLIGILALFLFANQFPLSQVITGYYNGIGDIHRADGKNRIAQEYYKLAAIQALTNHRSNYAAAAMAQNEDNYAEALNYYKNSLLKQPTPYAFVNTANLYQQQGSFFQALFTLQKGLKEFPDDAHITNNLAMLYAQTDILDSAFYFLARNKQHARLPSTTQTNQLALIMRTETDLPVDSMFVNTIGQHPEAQSNLLLYASRSRLKAEETASPPQDSVLNPLVFSWWYNYTLNQKGDTTYLSYLKSVSEIPENNFYGDELNFATAVAYYYAGDVIKSFDLLRYLQHLDTKKSGYYNHVLGVWCLQQNAPRQAQDYFQRALDGTYADALWQQALALLSTGNLPQARRMWNYHLRGEDPQPELLGEILNFMEHDTLGANIPDMQRMWRLQFAPDIHPKMILATIDSMTSSEAQAATASWALQRVSTRGQLSFYKGLDQYLDGYQETLRLWKIQQNIVANQLSKIPDVPVTFHNSWDRSWVVLGQALKAVALGDSAVAMQRYSLLAKNPFFIPGILSTAEFYNDHEGHEKAYEVLLEALRINEYQPDLLKEYGRQCVRMNLDSYAQLAIERLEPLIPARQWDNYRKELQDLAVRVQAEIENWDS